MPKSVAYAFPTNRIEEAFYLTAILNSTAINEKMKDFQAKGLFGERHVHRKILDIFFPRFDSTNDVHQELGNLSEVCHERASLYIKGNLPESGLAPHFLGRLRTDIKKHLENELKEIDLLVEEIIT